jgi:uncharacterized protein (DUF1778 family)
MAYKKFIGLRVFRSTKEMIEAAAHARGQSLSDFIRNSIIRDARTTLAGETQTRTEPDGE